MRAATIKRKVKKQTAVMPIDWKMVDQMLKSGCFGTEIAARLGMCPDNFYRRCEKEKNIEFSVYMARKRADGDALLKECQYQNATVDRDNGMLIWLGKNRLDQREPESRTVEACRPALLEYLERLKKVE